MTDRRKPINPWAAILIALKVLITGKPHQISFLKCDAKGCAHQEYYDAIDETLIDKPCPRCGANLLTLEDYQGVTP